MYIRQLKLSNVRCFESVTLEFARDSGWTVFAGRNGAGKSTLLQSIAALACGFSDGLFEPESFLREGSDSWNGSMTLDKHEQDRTDARDLSCQLKWRNGFQKDDRGLQGIEYLPHPPGCFLVGYGSFRRLSGHSDDALQRMSSRFWSGRLLTLFRNDASLAEAITWLRDIDYRSSKSDPDGRYRLLIKQALQILGDGLFPEGAQIKDVDPDGMIIMLEDRETRLHRLGDGFKAVAALVVDMLRNLFRSYGDLAFEQREDDKGVYPVSAHRGIVLIDEVETHLHMSWQREIGFWLKRHFPNIQFLVSTHSPLVCQAADSRGIIKLPDPQSEEAVAHLPEDQYLQIVNGNTDDAATSELFGLPFTHSNQTEKLRQRYAELEVQLLYDKLNAQQRKQLRKELNELEHLLPDGVLSE